MPYITKDKRASIDNLVTLRAQDAGELNYAITKLVNGYIEGRGKRYETINSAVGALECAKLELYRRVAAPYETQKALENGDVYPSAVPKPVTPCAHYWDYSCVLDARFCRKCGAKQEGRS